MATRYQFVDDSGETRLAGFLVPEPGGSSSVVVRGPFSFAFDTPALAAGIAFYTPTVGDYLLDGWFEIDTAFDGTTPKADFGSSDGLGVFSDTTNVVDLTLASRVDFVISGLTSIRVGADALAALLAQAPNGDAGGILGRFTSADPLQVWASQDGSRGGAAVGGAAGAAKLYIVTATPTAF